MKKSADKICHDKSLLEKAFIMTDEILLCKPVVKIAEFFFQSISFRVIFFESL